MYKRILLAYDGSEAGQKALLDAKDIVQWSRAEIMLIAVMPTPIAAIPSEGWVYSPEDDDADRAKYQDILDSGIRRLTEAGLNATGELVSGSSVDQIVRCAKRLNADLIVVGHKHLDSWAKRWWTGSVSSALIEQSPCSVLVVITH